jgi:type VI secretion system protein ImpF
LNEIVWPATGSRKKMAPPNREQRLTLSLLDRLLAGAHDSLQPDQSLRAVKLGVLRDLQNLLNTRWRCESWPPNLDQLEQSLVNYGIPDFTGVRFTTAQDREDLRTVIEDVIRRYEPRFVEVHVSLQTDGLDVLDRTLRFRIDALLQAIPRPAPITFETTVEPTTGDVEVRNTD